MAMYLTLSSVVIIICCLFTRAATLGSLPEITTRPGKLSRANALEYLHTWNKNAPLHQQNEENSVKPQTSIYIAHSNNSNLNPAINLRFQTHNSKASRKQDMYSLYTRDKTLSQPMSTLKKRLSLPSGIPDRYTSNKSANSSRINKITRSKVNNRALLSTGQKIKANGTINIHDNEKTSKRSRLERHVAHNYPVISENTTALVSNNTPYQKMHVLHSNKDSIRESPAINCKNTRCDLSNCGLTSVPQDLPSEITELFLNRNMIETLPPNRFSRYMFLESLTLAFNILFVLDEGAFNGLALLTSLDLSYNNFGQNTNISDRIFEPLTSLKVLRMYEYGLPCDSPPPYPDIYLTYLHNLEELYIGFYAQAFGPGFRNMTSLRNLTVICKPCVISSWETTIFINLGHIQVLSIHNCGIHGPSVDKELFSHLTNLTTLDISQNPNIGVEYLPAIMWSFQNLSLQTLIMNSIVDEFSVNFINSSVTQCLPKTLTTLIARENNILSVDLNSVMRLPSSIKVIDLSDNYLIVDPGMLRFLKTDGLEDLLINSGTQECFAGPRDDPDVYFGDKQTKYTETPKYEQGIGKKPRRIRAVLPPNLKRVQINVRHKHENFLLYIDKDNNLEELDLRCSLLPEVDFTTLERLPHLRILNLGRSSVQKIYSNPWIRIPPIEILILESNKLNYFLSISDLPFKGLHYLSYLDLTLNQLNDLHTHLFSELDSLEYLRLDGNTFSHFDTDISNLRKLKLLNLSNTGLPNLPIDAQSHIDHLCQVRPVQISVDMSECPIQCDCFNLDFLKWMVSSPAFHKNFTRYKCRYPDTSVKYILDGYKEIIHDLDRECAKNYPMFLLILAVTLILLCAVTGTIIYRFRWKIRYLYYAAYLKVMDKHRNENNHEFAYDVFISYDSQDAAFVRSCLSPELENRGLKLLIHGRDFVAGTYIASNIVMAVAESRKTLVVLTRNLLESSWCNYELQMATMEAVHTGRQVLMFLLKENIPSKELDVELLRHIKSNTYLPYPSPEDEGDEEITNRFYDKLAHDLKC